MAECSSAELARALRDRPNFSCLKRGEAFGLTITVEAGLLSLFAILCVFLIIARNVRWRMRNLPNKSLQIFHQPMDILMASLLLSDIVQAIGAVMSLKWAKAGKTEVGPYCTAQGVIRVLGATCVALSTLAIAFYTFLGVWLQNDIASMGFTLGVVVAIWVFVGFLIALALGLNRNDQNFNFIGPTPYWCWLNKYEVGYGWKILVEYGWLWLTLAVSLLIYVPLFLWMRGNLIIDSSAWWRCSFKSRADLDSETRARNRRSLVMLAYPVVYCICVIPLSAARWKSFLQGSNSVSPAATFAVGSLFALSGFFNAILLLKTRPASGLFGQLMFRSPARPPSPFEQHDETDTVDMALPPGFDHHV